MNCVPLSFALDSMFSSLMASNVPTAAAQPSALPPYVPPIIPGAMFLNRSSFVAKPAKGKPLAIPLANIMMSGVTFGAMDW